MQEFSAIEKRPQQDATKPRISIEDIAKEAGINLSLISPIEIVKRLKLLHEGSQTIEDERKCIEFAERLFEYYLKNIPEQAFTVEERRAVLVGTFLSDIGKTGPFDASPELSSNIIAMFEIDDHFDTNQVDVESFLGKYSDRLFPPPNNPKEKITRLLSLLRIIGVNPDMKMRQFYNLHTKWTLDILKHSQGIPHGAIVAAATHHTLEGVNPLEDAEIAIDKFNDLGVRGKLELNRAQMAVILLDKYEAARSRNKKSHQEAIQYLRDRIEGIPRFRANKDFKALTTSMEISLDDSKAN